jgi:type II secretory pathway pseudopilin PulG
MRQSLHPPPRRGGFTLVEMMVATALIIFIMYILASAFEKGLETFRMLKVAGNMQEQLRSASVTMRSDLTKPHFNDKGSSAEYLSDGPLDPTQPTWTPPDKGYFRIDCGSGSVYAIVEEGMDPDDPSLPRTRRLPTTANASTDLYPSLQFTVRLPGERQDQFFTTSGAGASLSQWNQPNYMAGASIFTSQWAEVSYFVQPTGTTPGGTQHYALYRRVKLLYDDQATTANPQLPKIPPQVIAPGDPNFANFSFWRRPSGSASSTAELNTPSKVTAAQRRFGTRPNQANGLAVYATTDTSMSPSMNVYGSASEVAGTDLLLANVTDFELKAQWDVPKIAGTKFNQAIYGPGAALTPTPGGVVDYPFDLIPSNKQNQFLRNRHVFDTWSHDEDTTGPSPEYSYGRPVDTLSPGNRVFRNGNVPGHGRYDQRNPDLANWNAGHFNNNSSFIAESMPLRVRITAVQIKIRIWDVKSQQSRQISIVQDL